jgi:hypothetical protein
MDECQKLSFLCRVASFVNDSSNIVIQVPGFLANIFSFASEYPSQTVLYYLILSVIIHLKFYPRPRFRLSTRPSTSHKADKQPSRCILPQHSLSAGNDTGSFQSGSRNLDESSKTQAEEDANVVRDLFINSLSRINGLIVRRGRRWLKRLCMFLMRLP